MTRVAILFDNYGPYHRARLTAVGKDSELLAVEVARRSGDYDWASEDQAKSIQPVSLFKGTSEGVSSTEIGQRLGPVLENFRPDVVAVPGWATRAALAMLAWCVAKGVPAVVMSDSQAIDEPRVWWKESPKQQVVRLFASGLVAGQPHVDYVARLGLPRDRIFLGYDAVDNDYFVAKAKEVRSQLSMVRGQLGLPERYFLASARFVEKKNLPRLLQAYARYRQLANAADHRPPTTDHRLTVVSSPVVPWSLVLLGDGPLRETLNSQLSTLNLQPHVHLPGFKQYPDLPAYYGCASAFIHASTTEQWGLVVNEAMASGLPVLVSNRCGCAPDLVQNGVNGFAFDPCDAEQLAQLMLKISAFHFPLSQFGAASARLIANWGPDRFASGLKAAVDCARRVGPIKPTLSQRVILKALLAR